MKRTEEENRIPAATDYQPDELNPELEPFKSRFPQASVSRGWVRALINFWLRFGPPHNKPDRKLVFKDVKLSNAKMRIYEPDPDVASGIGVLWIHGGGLVLGSRVTDLAICHRYVEKLGAVVCSTDYRLAPRHKYPAACDDCYEAWQWMQKNATELGIDQHRIIVAGMSAGGGLAAHLVQSIHDRGGVQPAAQSLWCPMLDDRTAARRELDRFDFMTWNNKNNEFGWSAYLGCPAGSAHVPVAAVPGRRQDLGGLPPAWIGVGTADLFHQECTDYVRRLREADIPTAYHEAPGAPHAFEIFAADTRLARDYYASETATMRSYLDV